MDHWLHRFSPGSPAVRLFLISVTVAHLCLYIWIIHLPLASTYWNDVVGWLMLASAHLLGMALCGWMALRSGTPHHTRWLLYGASILFQFIGMLLYLLRTMAFPSATHSPGLPILSLLLASVPLYFSLSLALDQTETRFVRGLDLLAALAMTLLFLRLVFSILTPMGTRGAEQAHMVDLIFDIKNLYLAAFACIRLLGTRRGEDRRYFATVFFVLLGSAAITSIRNRAIVHHNGSFWDLALNLQFLLPLLVLALLPGNISHPVRPPSYAVSFISRIGTSVMMSTGMLLLGMGLIRFHYIEGSIAIVAAALLSGVRINVAKEREVQLDPLTGIPNRGFLAQLLEQEWYRSFASAQGLAVVMIDVDNFKSLNDTYGHAYGDQALIRIAQTLRSSLNRASDSVGRYGGEEFLVILPSVTLEGAENVAQRLRNAVAELHMEHRESSFHKVTISAGVACSTGRNISSLEKLIEEADAALYRAKQNGRNCVACHEETTGPRPWEAQPTPLPASET
jgi:diguanylate cyclase (GGDEF)-like protein